MRAGRFGDAATAHYRLAVEALQVGGLRLAGRSFRIVFRSVPNLAPHLQLTQHSSLARAQDAATGDALGYGQAGGQPGPPAFSRHYAAAELYAAFDAVRERAARPFKTADDVSLFGAARWGGREGGGSGRGLWSS